LQEKNRFRPMKDAAKRWLRYEVADGVRVGMVRFADENLVIGMQDLTAMTAETREELPHKSKMKRPDNFAAEYWLILNKKGRKGPNFTKIVTLLLSYLILGRCPRNIVIFPLTQTKIVFFLNPNSFKKSKRENYWGTKFFSSAAEFFFWISRKVLQRVGNTGPGRHLLPRWRG
jgi:hypothetical protein